MARLQVDDHRGVAMVAVDADLVDGDVPRGSGRGLAVQLPQVPLVKGFHQMHVQPQQAVDRLVGHPQAKVSARQARVPVGDEVAGRLERDVLAHLRTTAGAAVPLVPSPRAGVVR